MFVQKIKTPLMPADPAVCCLNNKPEFILGYENNFIDIVQMVYGIGFLTEGSENAIEQMFQGIDLNHKKVLDIGSGLGGIDFMIAKQFDCEIVGIDPQIYFINKSRLRLEGVKNTLKGTIKFELVPSQNSLAHFANDSFDIVFGRECLYHLPVIEKALYLNQIYRVLKPGGSLITLDWMHKTGNYSDDLIKMNKIDKLACKLVTPYQYEKMLKTVGFKNVRLQDDTKKYLAVSQKDLEKLQQLEVIISARFGRETYELYEESWRLQTKLYEAGEIVVGNYRTEK